MKKNYHYKTMLRILDRALFIEGLHIQSIVNHENNDHMIVFIRDIKTNKIIDSFNSAKNDRADFIKLVENWQSYDRDLFNFSNKSKIPVLID